MEITGNDWKRVVLHGQPLIPAGTRVIKDGTEYIATHDSMVANLGGEKHVVRLALVIDTTRTHVSLVSEVTVK